MSTQTLFPTPPITSCQCLPEKTILLPGQSPEGAYILSVLLKRSYDINPGETCTRSPTDTRLNPGDVHYSGPMDSSVQFESDFIPFKIATDVVFNGKAYAPGNIAIEELHAAIKIGNYQKEIYVVGNRTCYSRAFGDPGFTVPKPFHSIDIRYELAYGGIDIFSNMSTQYPYPRNHLGKGFVVKNKRECIEGLVLPNIEDPQNILHPGNICLGNYKLWESQPMPQGFGWYSKSWQPRSPYAGVMPADKTTEQELRRVYSLIIPKEQQAIFEQTSLPSMDFRFFNGASQGLSVPFLKGDEQICCVNLSAEGTLLCKLPGEKPAIRVDVGFGEQHPDSFLQTVFIDMEKRRIDLVWRAAITYPGPQWLPNMNKMEIDIQ